VTGDGDVSEAVKRDERLVLACIPRIAFPWGSTAGATGLRSSHAQAREPGSDFFSTVNHDSRCSPTRTFMTDR
jgi:hypothetical protein